MFTTEEKVELLKKMQRRYLKTGLDDKDFTQLEKKHLFMSFQSLPHFKKPEEITMQDILAEER